MRTIKNIKMHEMIGLKTKIIDSTDQNMIGLSGTIINETQHMIFINTPKGLKKIPKMHNIWEFYLTDTTTTTIIGNDINRRSMERVRG
ncbi:MAG: ribonuclease P protein subunit [Nitrosopumilaceae archaeon]|nr:ribonuclease P protein subunit [Nitrosopumilaceae archaeon]